MPTFESNIEALVKGLPKDISRMFGEIEPKVKAFENLTGISLQDYQNMSELEKEETDKKWRKFINWV